MLKAQPEEAVAEYEKMPFEVAPFLVYLSRQNGHAMWNDSGAVATKTENSSGPAIGKPRRCGIGADGKNPNTRSKLPAQKAAATTGEISDASACVQRA